MDLSSKGSAIVQDPATQAEVASRQRRAAEREGRRRRRLQVSLTQIQMLNRQSNLNLIHKIKSIVKNYVYILIQLFKFIQESNHGCGGNWREEATQRRDELRRRVGDWGQS